MILFLKLLEKERLKRGWTQEEVATKIGVARPTYANYEKGKREPDFETSQKLADLFETTIDYLLGKSTTPLADEKAEANRKRAEKFSRLSPERQEQILELVKEWIGEDR
jgi:transcriptional regulator with XRE-family HTH domain